MRLILHLLDRWGRQVQAEFVIHRDTVEAWCNDASVGIVARDAFRDWLQAPEGSFAYDEVSWMVAGNGVALAIQDSVPCWPLDDAVLNDLRSKV